MPLYTQEQVAEALQDSEIGGGQGYDPAFDPDDVDVVVAGEDALHEECAKPGQTVYVDDETTFFLDETLTLAKGVTLLSGRSNGSQGATLITSEHGEDSAAENGIIQSRKDNVRISGLRLRGPKTTGWLSAGDLAENRAIGIHLYGDSRIDNCEIWGFPHAGIQIGSRTSAPEIEIDHCHIHSAYQRGLGYCVDVVNGHAHVHHNWLDEARHHLIGFGFDTCEYTAEKNVFGPKSLSHSVDMHCLAENFPTGSKLVTDDRTATGNPWYKWRAGGELIIQKNTFAFRESVEGRKEEAIAIRGEPADRVLIEGNRFAHEEPPARNSGNDSPGHCWRQVNVTLGSANVPTNDYGWTENWEIGENQFGPDTPWSPSYGAPVNLAPSDGDFDHDEAVAVAQALRGIRDPLRELNRAVSGTANGN